MCQTNKQQKANMWEQTQRAARFVVLSVSLCFLAVLTVLQLISTASVAYDQSEKVKIAAVNPLGTAAISALILLLLGGILTAIGKGTPRLGKRGGFGVKTERRLFAFFCGLTMVAGVALIFGVGEGLREDPLHVYESAVQLSMRENLTLMPGGYLFHKAHQLGLVTYERMLGLITFDVRFIFFLNLLFVNGINFLSYKMADMVFDHNQRVNLLTICLSYLFVPQFFFVVFAYGLVPGFFFLLLALYLIEKYFRDEKKRYLVAVVLSLSVATLLKSNYLIGAIVVAILCVLQTLRTKKLKALLVAVMAVVLPICCLKLLPLVYEARTGIPAVEGEPMITYVAMGVNPMNEGAGPGWYDGSNYNWYKNAEYDRARTIERAEECLRNCVTVYRTEPVRTAKFFVRKTISQWCEPLFQSVWSGHLEALGQQAEHPALRPLFLGEGAEPLLRLWMRGMLFLIYLSAFLFLWNKGKEAHGLEYAFLFFIGGFLFHLVWEAKSQYIYPYVFVMIPGCAYLLSDFAEKMKSRKKSKQMVENIDSTS